MTARPDSLVPCLILCASLALVACGDDEGPTILPDAGRDATTGDATTDASNPRDAALGDGDVPDGQKTVPDASLPCELATPALSAGDIHRGTFSQPVFVTQAPGETDALWVVEKAGRIRIIKDGEIEEAAFLDIRDAIDRSGGERGLLGLAFHPDYVNNRRFFVFYTPEQNRTKVAEYRTSEGNSLVAETTEVDEIFEWDDNDESNHVGGMIAFGGDGMLYVGVGDGGGGGDKHGPVGNGLNKGTVLGKILRFDVDNGPNYAAAGNPFSGDDGLSEIWAYGVRNPWRFSFDSANGDMFIGDVGQNRWEEISFGAAGVGGLNFGWRAYEANEVFDDSPATMALAQNHTPPLIAVRQEEDQNPILRGSKSITGGYVYRGSEISGLNGVYLFGDYSSDDVAGIRRCGDAFSEPGRIADLSRRGNGIASFGQDNAGEMYIVFYSDGVVRQILAAI